MSLQQQFAAEGVEWRRLENEDSIEFVVDFGSEQDSAVDMVGDTAIVVVGTDQYEFDIQREARVFINSGVLTVEVSK